MSNDTHSCRNPWAVQADSSRRGSSLESDRLPYLGHDTPPPKERYAESDRGNHMALVQEPATGRRPLHLAPDELTRRHPLGAVGDRASSGRLPPNYFLPRDVYGRASQSFLPRPA